VWTLVALFVAHVVLGWTPKEGAQHDKVREYTRKTRNWTVAVAWFVVLVILIVGATTNLVPRSKIDTTTRDQQTEDWQRGVMATATAQAPTPTPKQAPVPQK